MNNQVISHILSKLHPYTWAVLWSCVLLGAMAWYYSFNSFLIPFTVVVYGLLCSIAWYAPATTLLANILIIPLFERWHTLLPFVIGSSVVKIYPFDMVIILTLGTVLIRIVVSGKAFFLLQQFVSQWHQRPKAMHAIDTAILIWIGYGIAHALYSWAWGQNLFDILSTTKNYFFYPVVYFIMSWLFLQSKNAKKIRILFVDGFAVVSLLCLVFPLIGIIQGQGVWSEFTPLSTAGTRLIAATHSFFLAGAFLLSFFSWFHKIITNTSLHLLYANPLVTGIFAVTLLIGLYRNVWISVAIAVIAVLLLSTATRIQVLHIIKKYGIILLFSSVIMVLSLWYIDYLTQGGIQSFLGSIPLWQEIRARIVTMFSFSSSLEWDESASWRLAVWYGALKQWTLGGAIPFPLNTLFGEGSGAIIRFVFKDFAQELPIAGIHNDWLAKLVQLGLVGIVLFVMILREIWHALRKSIDTSPTIVWGMSFLVMGGVVAFFGTFFDTNIFSIWWWAVIALVTTASQHELAYE